MQFAAERALQLFHGFEGGHDAFVLCGTSDPEQLLDRMRVELWRAVEFVDVNRGINDCAVHYLESGGGSELAKRFAAKIETLEFQVFGGICWRNSMPVGPNTAESRGSAKKLLLPADVPRIPPF